MYLEGKFPEWLVTFGEISLDDLSINKLMSCSILNQIVQHSSVTIVLTGLLNIKMILCCKWWLKLKFLDNNIGYVHFLSF